MVEVFYRGQRCDAYPVPAPNGAQIIGYQLINYEGAVYGLVVPANQVELVEGNTPPLTSADYSLTFTQSNLSINSILPAVHGRNATPCAVTVLDDQRFEIVPDSIDLSNPNAIAVELLSFVPFTGQWLLLACFKESA